MSEEKVRVKLHKELLASEREELRQKRRKRTIVIILCFFFLLLGLGGGFVAAGLLKGTSVAAFKTNKFEKIISYFDAIWLYKNDYDSLQDEMEDKAFYGMTNFAEDPYSTYMSKSEIASFTSSINMDYVGIGAQYSYTGGVGTITRVFKDSPAEKGGMLAGDILLEVDGVDLSDYSSDEIKELISGVSGTNVTVTVNRAGERIDLVITRGAIQYTAYAETIGNVVVLNIMSFGDTTADECIKYLNDYRNYSKLIIDLRDNSGGYQDAVQTVAGLFLGSNVTVLHETDAKGITKSFNTIVKKHYDNFKDIVVLTNSNTASAAEVLTIALKEMHPNTTQVGLTTYGKGVVQSSFMLTDGSALKITSSYWTSPLGVSINKVGVVPDVEVRLDDILYETAYAMNEDTIFEYDSVSSYIKIAQEGLRFVGYSLDRYDGYFDVSLKEALESFQEEMHLDVTGKLDIETYNSIISSVIRVYNSDYKKDSQMVKALEILGY